MAVALHSGVVATAEKFIHLGTARQIAIPCVIVVLYVRWTSIMLKVGA
jgi:hypothetical protein